MLRLSVRRQPQSDHSIGAEKRFQAGMSVEHCGSDHDRWLELRFGTDGGSNFDLAITAKHFAELARMMVEVDPAAAIHAFGGAIQTAEVERRRPAIEEEAA